MSSMSDIIREMQPYATSNDNWPVYVMYPTPPGNPAIFEITSVPNEDFVADPEEQQETEHYEPNDEVAHSIPPCLETSRTGSNSLTTGVGAWTTDVTTEVNSSIRGLKSRSIDANSRMNGENSCLNDENSHVYDENSHAYGENVCRIEDNIPLNEDRFCRSIMNFCLNEKF